MARIVIDRTFTDTDVKNAVNVMTDELYNLTPEIAPQYSYNTNNGTSIRTGIRAGVYVIDKTLTATGFAGTEDVDWENIFTTQ